MVQYVLTLDQGTTSSRAILFNHQGQIVEMAQRDIQQSYPAPGWVEHHPNDIWVTQAAVAAEAMAKAGVSDQSLAAIGIANQRETTIIWDRQTGQPIYPAIVWQDRRTADICDQLKKAGHESMVHQKTGLRLDAYFSATKIRWILDHVEGAQEKAEKGQLCFGTVDSWLMAKLTNYQVHRTDISNASRTLLFNIHTQQWDADLLELFNIPEAMLPDVGETSQIHGHTQNTLFSRSIPIAGVAGDQQAALFGQLCLTPGMIKTTYGTGCFMMLNTGSQPHISDSNLLTTVAWKMKGQLTYALEGSVFMGGATIQWLRDQLQLIDDAKETEALAQSVQDNADVYFVPAMTGLGAPHWDQNARGEIIGLTRGSQRAHIVRAALESIVYQVNDIMQAKVNDTSIQIDQMRVDGGAVANNFLMQYQADISQTSVIRPQVIETTALGSAFLAGLAVGFWSDIEAIKALWQPEKTFKPQYSQHQAQRYIQRWHQAVERAKGWAQF